jgi:hypothetical protein
MKKMKKTGIPTAPGMGSMGGPPMMKPPMMGALDRKLRMAAAPPVKRPPVMKAKGMPLAGFAPAANKAPRRGKKGGKTQKVQKRFPI